MLLRKLPGSLCLAATILLLASPEIVAGPPTPVASTAPSATVDPFHQGAFELQVLDGAEYSLQTTGPLRPNVDYELTVLRLGYMIDTPHQGGTFLRGNDELLLEAEGWRHLPGARDRPGRLFHCLPAQFPRARSALGAVH